MRLIPIGAICIALLVPTASLAQQQRHDDGDLFRSGPAVGTAIGAIGAVTMVSMLGSWCDLGCENDMTAGGMFMIAGTGAAIGAAVGWIADRDARRFPSAGRRARVRFGPTLSQTWYRESTVDGSYMTRGLSFTIEASPHVRFQTEYSHAGTEMRPSSGSVPSSILDHVVETSDRGAGYSRAIFSRWMGSSLSETVGVRIPVSKIGIELVGGLIGQQVAKRDYYDAGPAQYKVLKFEAPYFRYIYGGDVTIPVMNNLVITPGVRWTSGGDSRTFRSGVAVQYRF